MQLQLFVDDVNDAVSTQFPVSCLPESCIPHSVLFPSAVVKKMVEVCTVAFLESLIVRHQL